MLNEVNQASVDGLQTTPITSGPTTALSCLRQPPIVLSSSIIPAPSRLAARGEPIYKDAFLNVLNDRFFFSDKTFGPNSHDAPNICSGWMTYARAMGKDKSLLSEVLLALSSVLVGADLQDPAITEDSRRRYQKAINGIRRAIETSDSTTNNAVVGESMLMTCLACAKYEVRKSFILERGR